MTTLARILALLIALTTLAGMAPAEAHAKRGWVTATVCENSSGQTHLYPGTGPTACPADSIATKVVRVPRGQLH